MRVIFTRHGETKENIASISMGQGTGGTLNEAGVLQAQQLAERLKDEQFNCIYASDLKRAVDTAVEILKFHTGVKLITTPELRERNLGVYEGGLREHWKKAMLESPLPFHAFKPTGGESYQEAQERVSNFFNKLLQQHSNDNLLIVGHTGILTMLFLYLFKHPLNLTEYERFKPGNTAVTICDVEKDGACEVYLLNCIKHLRLGRRLAS
mgnify:CR=1 FL=1